MLARGNTGAGRAGRWCLRGAQQADREQMGEWKIGWEVQPGQGDRVLQDSPVTLVVRIMWVMPIDIYIRN